MSDWRDMCTNLGSDLEEIVHTAICEEEESRMEVEGELNRRMIAIENNHAAIVEGLQRRIVKLELQFDELVNILKRGLIISPNEF